jgi:hypothetical protein
LPANVRSRLWTVDCLGPCERSNVVVVRTGDTRRWFGEVLDTGLTDALAGWIRAGGTRPLPALLAGAEFSPGLGAVVVARPMPIGGEDLARLVHATLAEEAGAWSIGVEGAVAEYAASHPARQIVRVGRSITAIDDDGGLRLTITDDVAAFVISGDDARPVLAVVLGVPHRNLEMPRRGVSLRSDDEPLRAHDYGATLADLGFGRRAVAFCVRSTDADIVRALQAVEGRDWPAALEEVGELLVARSPHRVVTSRAGRVEVFVPIPPADGVAPEGTHTHLSPGALELDQDLPSMFALPSGFAPVATFHPAPGWTY